MLSTPLIRFAALASVLCCVELPASRTLAVPFTEFVDPNPAPGNGFGSVVVPLSTGNVVITSPFDDGGGPNAGAVYLFNGSTGALISTLRGSTAEDQIGYFGVTTLTNGNYVIVSTNWDNGAIIDAGAVTWGNGTTGVSGTVSAANSLVGSTTYDNVGYGFPAVIALTNGNYVVSSVQCHSGAIARAGAVTWGNGTTGVSGIVSAANSLVGSTFADQVGNPGVTALPNGNYVVRSQFWDGGGNADVGAVTWGSGTTGVFGAVSAANSLVGTTALDQVGSIGVTALTNGNYVVPSPNWDNGAIADAGAATWGSGTAGVTGTISPANSLVGSSANDVVSLHGVTALTNGNYVVVSSSWDNGALTNVGAATWGSGTSGVVGTISAANSLVGSTANDQIGAGVTALVNGNYVVRSVNWDNGPTANAGAATWGSGTSGVVGTISAANSLVGSTNGDFGGGSGVVALTNGNYVVWTVSWDNGGTSNVGAATWGSGTSGISGVISPANSLVGSTTFDRVGFGGVTALTNGNYVVRSPVWINGANASAGAATWGNGVSGVVGTVSAANSLVGSSAFDNVSSGGVTALTNGNYLVRSPGWHNGAISDAGAFTWGSGTSGVIGTVSAANSLVGSNVNDASFGDVKALTNGNYVVTNHMWDNGAATDAGAATWGDGTTGTSGTISAANSLVGSTASDEVGFGVTLLANGNYVIASSSWDNGATVDAGAATLGRAAAGVSGVVSSGNSLVGPVANTGMGLAVDDPVNGTFMCTFFQEDGGRVRVASSATVSVPDPSIAGLTVSLDGPQPNPARSKFRYAVALPVAMRVRVDLYDVAGRRLLQLVDRHLPAGHHGLEWSRGSAALGPGLYFLRLRGAGTQAVRAVVLLE